MVFAIASVNCNSASPVLCVLCSACLPQSKMPAGAILSGFMLVRLPVAAEDAKKRAVCHAMPGWPPSPQIRQLSKPYFAKRQMSYQSGT
jgi:hypothetical protein